MNKHRSLAWRPSRTAPASPTAGAASRESGSAYVLTLMVLLVLSLLGLILALTTQSEVEIGANERTVNRTFYTAEAGISVATANYFLGIEGVTLTQMDSSTSIYGTRVTVPPFLQVGVGPAELSQINQDTKYRSITNAVSSAATRFAKVSSSEEKTLGTKNLEMMLLLTPAEEHVSGRVDEFKDSDRYKKP